MVASPDGAVLPAAPRHVATNADPSLLKALGRAFQWKRLLDDGTYASVADIARAGKVNHGTPNASCGDQSLPTS